MARYRERDIQGEGGEGGFALRLSNLALAYVRERQRRGELGDKAAANVRRNLRDFCDDAPHDPRKITRKHVEKYLDRPGLAASTRRLRLSDVRGFTRWLVLNQHAKTDPTAGIKGPQVPKSAPRRLIHNHAAATVRHAPDSRGVVIVLLQLQEGLRCIEVNRAEVGDLDLVAGTLGVRGKGGDKKTTRHLPLSVETIAALERYLTEHPAPAGPLIRSYIDPTQPISASYIGSLVSRWMYAAGVKQAPRDGKSAHALRHTALSDMADRGASIFVIKQAAGHDALSSTEIYTRGVTPDLREGMGGRSYLDRDPRQSSLF